MSIADWPSQERPREKLLQSGAENLSDAELLAIFLRVGVPGKSAVDLARHMLQHFGSLQAMFNASLAQFCALTTAAPRVCYHNFLCQFCFSQILIWAAKS